MNASNIDIGSGLVGIDVYRSALNSAISLFSSSS